MKNHTRDTRHQQRITMMQYIFAQSFVVGTDQPQRKEKTIDSAEEHRSLNKEQVTPDEHDEADVIDYRDLTASQKHIIDGIAKNQKRIDMYIAENAPKFPLDRISKTDIAILRLAIYELIIAPQQPHRVIINESVQLAREFGGDRSYAFVNGVLGKLITAHEKIII